MSVVNVQERIDRLRQLLGKQTVRAHAAANEDNSGSNIFLGIALHALARQSQGKSLSNLEALMIKPFQVLADDDAELQTYGKMVSEMKTTAKSAGTSVANLPLSFMDLPEDEPYTRAKLFEDAERNGLQVFEQANYQVVDPAKMDQLAVEEKFNETLAATGRGMTIFWSEDDKVKPSLAGSEADSHITQSRTNRKFRLVADRFKCHKASAEPSKDEIYWAVAYGSDTGDAGETLTREYGSIKSGDERTFDSGTVVFEGVVDKAIAAHIMCWEADSRGADWDRKLTNALKKISLICNQFSNFSGVPWYDSLIGNVPFASPIFELVFWGEQIANLILNLMDIFRNHDDLVKEHWFAWNYTALEKFSTSSFMFDGGKGGKHELWLKMESKSTDVASLSLSKSTSVPPKFGAPTVIGHQNVRGACGGYRPLAARSVYAQSRESDDKIILPTSLEADPDKESPISGSLCPTLPSFVTDTVMGAYVASQGADQGIYIQHQQLIGGSWVGQRIGHGLTAISPVVSIFRNLIVCVHFGNDERYHYAFLDRGVAEMQWSDWIPITNLEPAPYPPALIWNKEKSELNILFSEKETEVLHLGVMSEDDIKKKKTSIWEFSIPEQAAASAISTVTWKDKQWVAYRGHDSFRVHVAEFDLVNRKLINEFKSNLDTCGPPTIYSDTTSLCLVYPNRTK